jgi:hypothetical protein
MKPGISDGSETARAQLSYEPLTFVNVELHGAFIPVCTENPKSERNGDEVRPGWHVNE